MVSDGPLGQIAIPCSLYRGGTSRGLLIQSRDLPYPRAVIERVLLRMLGSPDARQIDGFGSGSSQASKVMIVEPASGDADVRMTFAQVAVDVPVVDWGGNCGNMTTAVGPFAIATGMVEAVEPMTTVRIVSANTGARVEVHVPVRDGQVVTDGDFAITGVVGTGAEIAVEWFEPAGTVTGRLLPTGLSIETFVLGDGRQIEVSIVDAANPVVFCRAASFGLTGTELPDALTDRRDVIRALEEIRGIAAERLGLVPSRAVATQRSPGLPKVAVVAPPAGYSTSTGELLDASCHDLHVRMMSMQTPHRSLAASGAICTAVAATVEGSVVHGACRADVGRERRIRIAHPYGVMAVEVEASSRAQGLVVTAVRVSRTARLIMAGVAYVPAALVATSETAAITRDEASVPATNRVKRG